jgi:hypothetical protein
MEIVLFLVLLCFFLASFAIGGNGKHRDTGSDVWE